MKNDSSFKLNPNFHIMCLYTKDLRKHKIGPAFDEQHNMYYNVQDFLIATDVSVRTAPFPINRTGNDAKS